VSAIAHNADRLDRQRAQQPLGSIGCQPQSKVSAPRVPDHPRARPLKAVEHRYCVLDGLRHRERAFERGGDEAPLLVGGDPEFRGQLSAEIVEIGVVEPGAAVKQQHRRPRALDPATQ
jgi:hypothetical protein